jgi:signal transduction histidine kinase/ActR/RegA family two-component response regulator
MEIPPTPFWPWSLASGLVMAVLAACAWPRRRMPGARVLFWTLATIAYLCITAALEERATTLAAHEFWLHVQIPSYAAEPVLWLLLARSCSGRSVSGRWIGWLFVLPAAAVLLHWSNAWHHLYWQRLWVDYTGPRPIMGRTYGTGFWFFVAYCQLMMVAGVAVLVRYLPKEALRRRRNLLLLAAVLLPEAANLLYTFDLQPVRYLDITPYALGASGLCMYWIMFRYHLQGVVPVAMKSVVSSMADGVLVFDLDGRVADLNPAAEGLLGCPSAGLLGRAAREVLGEFPELIGLHERSGPAAGDLTLPGGECAASAVDILRDSQRVGRVINLRDVTAEREASRQLDEARQAAEAAAVAKSRFLANMSHEIRTPISGVVGASELLLDSELDSDQRELAETARESARALLDVLNDVLDFSKIDAGQLDLEQVPFDLRRLADGVVRIMRPAARQKKLELTARVAPEVPAGLIGDPTRLRQVLLNLVGNAIKFTESGQVSVSVEASPAQAELARLTIDVQDTGIGIAADRIEMLFDEFSQADSSVTRRFGGTGLGLAISRRLVRQMGGDIRVRSEPGQGSGFTIEIPLPVSAEKPVSEAPPADLTVRGARILLVEDNLINQRIARRLLEKLGCSVEVGANGLEAVELARGGSFDLVLMDLQMPEMGGLAATREIRRHDRRTPVFAFTASVLDETRAECRAAGMNGLLAKPIRVEEVATALKALQTAARPDGPGA